MANSYSFRNSSIDNFKVITWLLIFFVSISPVITMKSALAFSNDDWLKVPEQQNENTKVSGSKTYSDGRKATSSVIIPPNVSRVVRQIVKLGAVIAVTDAITQLIGAGVDWVLDPENNRVKYKQPENGLTVPNSQYYYISSAWGTTRYYSSNDSAAQDTCKRNASGYGWIYVSHVAASFTSTEQGVKNAQCTIKRSATSPNEDFAWAYQRVYNSSYDPSKPIEYLYIDYDQLAQKIISNAAAAKPNAPEFIFLANTDLIPEEEKALDQQLEANKKYDTNNTAKSEAENTPTGATEPTSKTSTETQLPPACEYFPTLCEWLGWTMEEPVSDDGSLDLEQLNIQLDDSQIINFGNSCPAPETVSFSYMGRSESLEFSYQPLCQFMDMIRPFVIAASYLIGAYIVMGLSRGSGD